LEVDLRHKKKYLWLGKKKKKRAITTCSKRSAIHPQRQELSRKKKGEKSHLARRRGLNGKRFCPGRPAGPVTCTPGGKKKNARLMEDAGVGELSGKSARAQKTKVGVKKGNYRERIEHELSAT